MKAKQVRYDHLFKQLRGCAVSGVATLGSGLGTATGIFKLKQDLGAMLQSDDFLTDVMKRQGSGNNMEKQATHLVDAAIRMGAQILSVDFI